ncbi:MAG: DUF3995 domain-containing protein [Actinomycetota bacterium]|nr:DUF3995 domain-containing protein [Actinomycetota bacterium]
MTNEQVLHTSGSPVARTSAIAVGAILGAIAVLHAMWAAGSSWPFSDRESLSETVWGGPASTLPSPAATMAVTGLLVVAILLVTGQAGMWGNRMPRWVFAVGTGGVATVLLLRGLLFGIAAIGSEAVNRTWELALYSPLCIVLGVLCAIVVHNGSRSPTTSSPSPNTD